MFLSCYCTSFWCAFVPGRTGKTKILRNKRRKTLSLGYLCGPARSRECFAEITSAIPLAAADSWVQEAELSPWKQGEGPSPSLREAVWHYVLSRSTLLLASVPPSGEGELQLLLP